jgi:hypothetical protein
VSYEAWRALSYIQFANKLLPSRFFTLTCLELPVKGLEFVSLVGQRRVQCGLDRHVPQFEEWYSELFSLAVIGLGFKD